MPLPYRLTIGAASVVVGAACTRVSPSMPFVDGPLELVVRYPPDNGLAPGDSTAAWGSLGTGRATLTLNGRSVRVKPNGGFVAWVPVPRGPTPTLEFLAALDGRMVRRLVRLTRPPHLNPASTPFRAGPSPAAGWVQLRRLPSDTADSVTQRRPVFSRWFPGGPLALPLPLGARLPRDARTADAVRLRLSEAVRVWVSVKETDTLARPRADPLPLGSVTLAEREGVLEVSVAAGEPLPSMVDIEGSKVRWSIFGARHASDLFETVPSGVYLSGASRRAGPPGRADFELLTASPPVGWRTRWEDGKLVLQLRRRWPAARGLSGLVVALDAGHPPGGSVGPTGLREDSVTLAVAQAAARELQHLGARPILVRHDPRPLSLEARIAIAEAADARVFVSIHLDAPGDGRSPWSADGTQTLYYQPFAGRLAHVLEDSVSAAMRQPSRGTSEADLAVLRATWFPAALVEGTCLVLPEREAWLRTPAGIARYAAGIVAGLARWASDTAVP
jgi:N-acetylmuramoyl-L-alanine amidase